MDVEKVLFQIASMKDGEVFKTSIGDIKKIDSETFKLIVHDKHHRVTAEQLQIESSTAEDLF